MVPQNKFAVLEYVQSKHVQKLLKHVVRTVHLGYFFAYNDKNTILHCRRFIKKIRTLNIYIHLLVLINSL